MYGWQRFTEYLRMIRFSHSVFALPFAYSGAVLAGKHSPLNVSKIFWITMAMVGARSAAMGFNRLVDRNIDARNQRTSGRALPQGRINVTSVFIFISISLTVFFFSAAMLNKLALLLSPVAVFVVFSYSFTKRWTVLSHYVLGISLGIAPVGAWIGVTGKLGVIPMLMSAGVILWVAGFDIIYSLSDIKVDRKEGLKSIPAKFGVDKSLWISRFTHLAAFIFFSIVYFMTCEPLLSAFFLAIILTMLLYQHISLKPDDEKSVERAFFFGNSIISVVFFTGILISLLFFI